MEDSNRLIAEFMDLKYTGLSIYKPSEYKYHTSWGWLIPVMKKIDSYANEEMSFAEYDDYKNTYFFIADISLHNDISDVYNQVVGFIKQLKQD